MIDLLWRHSASLARAADEVRRLVADPADPTLDELAELDELDFVEACAHETMRLKPVAPVIGLQALRDTVVGNVRLPAGGVIINVMRRDSVSDQHLPRAAAFEPERWLADGTPGAVAHAASAAKRVSMPFGAGPRICRCESEGQRKPVRLRLGNQFVGCAAEDEQTDYWRMTDCFHQRALDASARSHAISVVDLQGNRLSRQFEGLAQERR